MKKVIVLLAVYLTSAAVQAKTVGEALKDCSREENALKRLVCYDRLVKDINQYAGLDKQAAVALPVVRADIPANRPTPVHAEQPTTPSAQSQLTKPAPAKPVVANPTSDFGLENKKPKKQSVEKIFAEVAEVKTDPYKKLIVTFSDGQVWRQTDSVRLRVSPGDQVFVERGSLSSFFMGKESANKRIRVKRSK